MDDDEYRSFAKECMAELQRKQGQIAEILAFENELDFVSYVVRFTAEGDLFMEADLVPIGSRGLKSGTWLWAWANPSIKAQTDASVPPLPKIDSMAGRKQFAAENAFAATEHQAWEFAAIACRHLNGNGVFRFEINDSDWFFVICKLTYHRPEAEIVYQAELAVERSLLAARGPGLLNMLRKRFAALRVNLIDADLRGPPQPWAHDLHVQPLLEQGYIMQQALRETSPQKSPELAPHLTSHQAERSSGADPPSRNSTARSSEARCCAERRWKVRRLLTRTFLVLISGMPRCARRS